MVQAEHETLESSLDRESITLLLCGDVMTGRGIDQALPHPGNPRICEPYVTSATEYLALAERKNGPLPRPLDFTYIWGDALEELAQVNPDLRIVNLETAVTRSEDCSDKGISYRMNPDNIPCIVAAGIDCCVLANNHVLDWGRGGLLETLEVLRKAGIANAGAGRNRKEAAAPALLSVPGKGRALVFSFGLPSSGIPIDWAAGEERPGVNLLRDLSGGELDDFAKEVKAVKKTGDIVIASIHWGANWGYEVPEAQRDFARNLIDVAGVNVIHGHSSHHVKGMEVYKGQLIIYGCGDFFDDYEGIAGYEKYRDDLVLMYVVTLDTRTGLLLSCEMKPFQIRRFRLNRASEEDANWLRDVLCREGSKLGTRVEIDRNGQLVLSWK